MGAWGTGVSSSDTFKDIYGEFIEQFNRSIPFSDIKRHLEQTYSSLLNDSDESNEFYFAIAKAQWDCGALEKAVLQQVREIVESGSEIRRWQTLGASDKDTKKREKAIHDFLEQLSQANPKPKKPKPIRLVDAIFEQGDCLAIPLGDDKYGAALVLSTEKQTQFGVNLLLGVDYFSTAKPTVQSIVKGRCLNRHVQSMRPRPDLQYCYAKDFTKSRYTPEKIGEIQFKTVILPKNAPLAYGRWDSFAEAIKHEKLHNHNEKDALKVSQVIKRSLFW